jgi:hypothetical protein
MIASTANSPEQEAKDEVQIKDKGQSKVDAIHQKAHAQEGARSMGADKQCHKEAKKTTVFGPTPPHPVGQYTRIHQPNLPGEKGFGPVYERHQKS